jgi:hypothetical protein
MADSGLQLVIVCEDSAHYFLATELADRVLLHEAQARGADWIDDRSLAHLRSFAGPDGAPGYCSMSRAKQIAEDLGRTVTVGGRPIKLRGHITPGQALGPETGFWRRVLLHFAAQEAPPALVIVMKDTDGEHARLDGLRKALSLVGNLPVIVGAPHQDAEAWFVAGFQPASTLERDRHATCTGDLMFDPCQQPHRLTAHPNDATTDAKRVLRRIAFGDDRSCPPSPDELVGLCERTLRDLRVLEARGAQCGLATFLADLHERYVPLFIPGPAPAR